MEFLKRKAGSDQSFLWLPVSLGGGVTGICKGVKTDGRNLLLSYLFWFCSVFTPPSK